MVLAAAAAVNTPARAQTADTVVLRSGNPVIGEVKYLTRGNLSFDTNEMDVVKIDWDDIAFIVSGQFLEIQTAGLQEYYGSLAAGPDTATVVIVGSARTDTLALHDIVRIRPFDLGFFARTSGYVDLGTNIARANRLRSILLKGQFNYRGPKWGFNVFSDFYRQTQESTDDLGQTFDQSTSRSSASLRGDRFIGARWALSASGELAQNEELSLDGRLLAVLGGQFQIIRNQGIEFWVGAGGTLNDEQFEGQPRNTSGEILLAAGFDAFDIGDLDVFSTLSTYSNPSGDGRIRVEFDGRLAWEIFSDFNVGLTITERFDSSPPSPDAANRDYQYSFTLGWSWS